MTTGRPLRVIAFPGAPNLPTFAALDNGFFEDRGVRVSIEFTKSSVEQARRVARGEFDVAFTAFDNVAAYASGQGAAGPDVDPEYVAIMGATRLEVSLIVEPTVEHHRDLIDRTIALDALDTGFAFILYEMLDRAGVDRSRCTFDAVGATPQRWQAVRAGTHAATLTIEPFTSLATAEGYRKLDSSSDIFEEYQGGVVAARRSLIDDRPDALRSLIDGYLDGLAWSLEPSNRDAAGELLGERMDLDPSATSAVLDRLLAPETGLTPDGRLLPRGVATVLALRSKYGTRPVSTRVEDYADLRLWDAAMASRSPGGAGA